jgi:hypothetical protein
MTINPVSSSAAYAGYGAQSAQPAAAQKSAAPQDTVQLSAAAKAAAGGDADHDGDSH